MCNYQGYEFGATYLDSVCIDGLLWDADSGSSAADGEWYYTVGGDIPCPQCCHADWLEYGREDVEGEGWVAADKGTPADQNPYITRKLRYEEDRETLKGWWLQGFRQYAVEAA